MCCPLMCDNVVDGTKPRLEFSCRVVCSYQQNITLAVQQNPHQSKETISVAVHLLTFKIQAVKFTVK